MINIKVEKIIRKSFVTGERWLNDNMQRIRFLNGECRDILREDAAIYNNAYRDKKMIAIPKGKNTKW